MFRTTQVLKALQRIFWTDSNVYRGSPTMKTAAENAVKAHYQTQKLEDRNITEASIRGPFHTTPGESQAHITVDFKKSDGTHVTTHHVTE